MAQKNVHAHPFDFRLCHFTGLGIHIALWKETVKGTKRPFLSSNAKEGIASKACVKQLQSVISRHQEELETHVSLNGFNLHGLWKGATICATSGMTVVPSVPAIARCGEWSVGQVLDCHWHFSQTGDQCLGRVLTGLDPTGLDFDCPPPYFNLDNPMGNPCVKRAMKMTFGWFLDEHLDFTGILCCCLVSIVHHKDSLIHQMVQVPGHNFNSIAVLHEPTLLGNCTN